MLREHGMRGNCVAATPRPPQQDGCIGEAGRPSSDTIVLKLPIKFYVYACMHTSMYVYTCNRTVCAHKRGKGEICGDLLVSSQYPFPAIHFLIL